jgi:two-component system, sensor histidine kinase RegB
MIDLNPVLQRLALLQLSVASVWLLLLGYLQSQHVANLDPAWILLGLYLPILMFSNWQGYRRNIREWQLFLHILVECQVLTGLLFFSGGVTNPLISYYLVLLVIAAYGLSWQYTIWLTLLSIGDYSLLGIWYQPLLIHNSSSGLGGHSLTEWHLSGMWLTFVLCALILTTLIPMLVRSRQLQQLEIQRLREQQLKNEQLIGIGTLAAGTAHEMGTPLMTMSMLLEDLLLDAPENLVADIQLLRQQVQRCQESLQKLARQGREVRQSHLVNAHEWLHTQLQRWQLSHPKAVWQENPAGAQTDARIAASPLLDQALLNLLNNASEAGDQTIQLQQHLDAGFWCLDILQPDPAAASTLADYSPWSSSKQHGLGMGHYLSNASVEQFGGNIQLLTGPTGGSLCRLRLPLSKKPALKTTKAELTKVKSHG